MSTVMKITASGQISLPAEIRRKWATDRVVVTETIDGLLVRPFDPNAIRRIRGKYKDMPGLSYDDARAVERRGEVEGE